MFIMAGISDTFEKTHVAFPLQEKNPSIHCQPCDILEKDQQVDPP